jgi:hypothetical protein
MLIEKPYYIYQHIRPDTNDVFYIGKGNLTTKGHGVRHLQKYGRNKFWKSIVAKNNGNYISEIIFYCETEEEVNAKEIELIKFHGRRDLNTGTLCNLTDGADGSTGIVISEATRKKLSDMFSGEGHPNYGKKLSEETCRRKSESMKSSSLNLKGKKLPEWWKDKISATKFGDMNPMFGKRSPRAKTVIDTNTGIIYDSIMDAAKSTPYQFQYISAMLNGSKINKTTLKFAENG